MLRKVESFVKLSHVRIMQTRYKSRYKTTSAARPPEGVRRRSLPKVPFGDHKREATYALYCPSSLANERDDRPRVHRGRARREAAIARRSVYLILAIGYSK